MEDQLLTTSDVARALEVSSDTVRLWERRGILRATRTRSGVRLFSREDVDALFARRQATQFAAEEA